MGAPPRSLTRAIRDLSALGATAFVLGAALAAASTQVDRLSLVRATTRVTLDDIPFVWGGILRADAGWTVAVLLGAAACWHATRARRGRVGRRLPVSVATLLVAADTVAAVTLDAGSWWVGGVWPGPGPSMPYGWSADGGGGVVLAHPAWGFPLLVVALLAAASGLGARAGALPDDGASHRVAAVPLSGRLLAAAVVGLPAVGATAAAVLAYRRLDGDIGLGTGLVGELAPTLLGVVAVAALLSGTGRSGAVVTGLVGLGAVAPSVSAWVPGANDVPVLALAGGCAVLCLAVALWRPCAVWGAEILGPLLVRSAPPAAAPTAAPLPGGPDAP